MIFFIRKNLIKKSKILKEHSLVLKVEQADRADRENKFDDRISEQRTRLTLVCRLKFPSLFYPIINTVCMSEDYIEFTSKVAAPHNEVLSCERTKKEIGNKFLVFSN